MDLTKDTIKLGCFLCRKVLNYELKKFNEYKLFYFVFLILTLTKG